uniref:Flavin-containing monooxygenase n=1 Tax=Globodera pallida TaxID=36090 RepID=A0A183C9P5_GLOPA
MSKSQKTVIEKSALANSLLELNGSRVVDVVDDSLVLADGRMIGGLDFVLFCTGYCFNFPFFDQSQNSSVIFCDGNLVSPLIGHVAHPDYLKALFFIGLNLLVDPFPCFDVQTHFALALLKDRVPNASERFTMEVAKHWEEKRIKRMNADKIAQKYFHKLGPDQWEYFDWLNSLSGFKPLPKVVEHIYKRNVELKSENPLTYRNFRYRIVDEQKFRTELPK